MNNTIFLILTVLSMFLFSCQSAESDSKTSSKPKTSVGKKQQSVQKKGNLNQNKQKNLTNAQQKQQNRNNIKQSTKNSSNKVQQKSSTAKKSKYPSLEEQKKALGLTDKQVNDIIEAQRAAKKDRSEAKRKKGGKISKQELIKINNIKAKKIQKSLGVELYKKRQDYVQNYTSK